MNKEVLYIDVDDDITAIIGKVKAADAKVVALVPPKRIGVLQSAVNLRILQRVAKNVKKHVVLITNDKALLPLAAGAGIPVAKNLQSKPEVLEVPALKVDGDDDIIDGAALSVGEHDDASKTKERKSEDKAVAALDADEKKAKAGDTPKKSKKIQKVPNFNSFRKKLFIGAGIGILLLAFLIWAVKYAPKATVVLFAKTTTESVATSVSLSQSGATSLEKATIRSVVASEKKESTVEFQATGKRDEGERASGTMTISSTSPSAVKIPVGTGFSSGDCTFTTTTAVEVPGVSVGPWRGEGSGFSYIPGKVDVGVRATKIGDECNLSARNYEPTVKGVKAAGSAMQGGSKRQVTFVTQADVQKASEQLAQSDTDAQKAALQKKLGKSVHIIDDSFTTSEGSVSSSPEVNQEASDGKAKLVASVTYSLTGVQKEELDTFLNQALTQKLSKETARRVYDSGVKSVAFSGFKQENNVTSVDISAKGQVGPKVDDSEIKRRVKGKKFGDIQSDLKSIQGINDVNVEFSPFWVRTVPNEEEKITIRFNIKKNG